MSRPVTIFTSQFSDMPFEKFCAFAADCGYDGIELATAGGWLDIEKAAKDLNYCKAIRKTLKKYGLCLHAISNHLAGQLVCDLNNDSRSDAFAPKKFAGDPEGKRKWAVKCMKASAKAAKNLGADVVTGFTGSSIWHLLYSFPPVPPEDIRKGFQFFADQFNPIMDEFGKQGIRFALEVHPTEIAFDLYSAERALDAIGHRPEFGFNFDPSHLFWQGVDPVKFIQAFPDRIYHCHVKDAAVTLDGKSGILSSHLDFGDGRRGWDFRSPGHGDVDFEAIIRALNRIGYTGPLSVEWEDCGMDREFGARDACQFAKSINFAPSNVQFDDVFKKK